MTRKVDTHDVFAAVVSEDIDPSNPQQRDTLMEELSVVAENYVLRQWTGQRRRPLTVINMVSEWSITNEPGKIAEFQPADDCVACRAGNDQATAFLRDHPGRWVALANLKYTEVWAT